MHYSAAKRYKTLVWESVLRCAKGRATKEVGGRRNLTTEVKSRAGHQKVQAELIARLVNTFIARSD
jgi:hypothetical protein